MRAIVISVGLLAASCGDVAQQKVQRLQQASIYGADDRTEVADAPEPWKEMGERSVLALLFQKGLSKRELNFCVGPTARFDSLTVGQDNGLCASVRFQSQPFAAGCSSTLVAPSLLLTAKHCLVDRPQPMAFRGFVMQADGGLPVVTPDDVFGVRRVFMSDRQDLALLELSQPLDGRVVPIAPQTRKLGDPVTVIGYPNGGPAKVSSGCHILQATGDRFLSNCEVFPGNSGSGIFNSSGALAGVVVSTGIGVFRATDAGCKIDFVYTDAGQIIEGVGAPQLTTSIDPGGFISEICDGGYASVVCGRAASCGDGQCTDGETAATCAGDCAEGRCGDGICAGGEVLGCVEDCGEGACSFVPAPDAGAAPVNPPPPPTQGCSSVEGVSLLAALAVALRARTSPSR